MDIAAGLTALNSALSTIKQLQDIDKNFDKAELKLRMATLYSDLADARIALSDARELVREKDVEIARLKARDDSKLPVVFHQGFNFGIGPDGRSIGRAFCPACEKVKGIQMQLTRTPTGRADMRPHCLAVYQGAPLKLPDDLQPGPAPA